MPFTTLALGGSVQVPTLDGEDALHVPDGTPSGTVLKIRHKGLPNVSGRGHGDLFVSVVASVPRKLSKEQRKAMEELRRRAAGRRPADRARLRREAVLRTGQGHLRVKRWPALDIRVGPEAGRAVAGREAQADRAGLFAAWLDDFAPTAITELDASGDDTLAWRVFFASDEARTIAAHALAAAPAWTGATASSIDVDDEAWAERSQASLTAIRVGRVVVTPPWDLDGAAALARDAGRRGRSIRSPS